MAPPAPIKLARARVSAVNDEHKIARGHREPSARDGITDPDTSPPISGDASRVPGYTATRPEAAAGVIFVRPT